MLIPYSTDAPIYHYPIATVALIVINVIFFFAFCIEREEELPSIHITDNTGREVSPDEVQAKLDELEQANGDADAYFESLTFTDLTPKTIGDRLILDFGEGFKPWQWFTAMFMHADAMHLIGNMVFLWSFGLVVEGKLGNVVFPLVYIAMGVVQAIVVQTIMWFSIGGALGASGAIFSVLALVVIFAPVNSFEVILLVGRFAAFEIPILVFGGIYLGINFLGFFIGGSQMSSEALHLVGFGVGIPVGLVMLTKGYVDCEGYDVISYFQGTKGEESTVGKKMTKDEKATAKLAKAKAKAPVDPDAGRKLIQGQLDLAISSQQYDAAVALQTKMSREVPGSTWNQQQLASVIQGYMKAKEYQKAEPLLELHIQSFETNQFQFQVILLKLWLQGQKPRKAYKYMQGMNLAFMTPEEKSQIQKLAAYARKQVESGVNDAF